MASDDNAYKYFLFHFETGAKVFFRVLSWLYQGKSPIECLVVDLAYTKEIILDGDEEKKMVNKLENGNIGLCDLDLTLLYKITQSVCGLKKKTDQVWSKRCPSNQKAELEHLLFLLNDGQNCVKTIIESELVSILNKAGQRGDVDAQQVNDAISKMRDYFQVILNDDKIDGSTKYNKCGAYVINTILPWLYKGQSPIKDLVIDLTKMKTIETNKTQKKILEGLRNEDITLSDLDISFQFQIIQSVCGLADRNDNVWEKTDELEFLISKLKNSRNDVTHRFLELKNMTDSDLEVKSDEMKSLLTSIIEKAGQRAQIDVQEVRDAITLIQDDIERIRNNDKIDEYMKPRILEQILNDLKFSNEAELKSSFENELKGYSAPDLRSNNSKSKIPLRDLLTFEDQVIVVQGEAGEGKTSLTKFLYNSCLSGNTNIMEGLSSFEVVLRVNCNQIFSSDIILFYEKTFPIASSAFPKKGSLKKYFDEFKVLWIMDGFDECTTELKGFLTAMTNSLSERHKLLITTRPHTYEDLKGHLGELSMTSLTLELLQDRNVEEIIQSLITEDEKKETFKTHFKTTLDEAAKHLLRTPLNLNLYIQLWIQDPELVRNTYTTKLLFLKTIYHNLSLLQERLVGRTCWSSEDLKGYVEDWFYGSLCKQSFLMLMQDSENFISKEDLDTLKKDARDSKLDPSRCLSSFLVKGKRYDWEDEEERENEEEDEGESENDGDGEELEYKEEDEGEFRYEFHHLTQQYILASLFLKHFKDYDGENVINSISPPVYWDPLIRFYVEMSLEDGSLDNDCTQVFYPIQYIISRVDDMLDKSDFWLTTSVATKFNVEYMKKVSQAFEDIPYLYLDCLLSLFLQSLYITNLTKFLDFVHPQKIILSYLSFQLIQEEYFQPLLEFLINSKLEIEIKNFNYDYPSFESDDAFCGSIDYFLYRLRNDRKNWKEEMKTNCITVNEEYQINKKIFETLKESKALERLEIRIDLDSFLLPFPTIIPNIPKEMVEITTIGLMGLNIENFEKVLEELNKKKGDGSLKFKALHHDFKDISETDKRQLQKIAHTVSIDFICQCKKDVVAKIDKMNITSFVGDIQMLKALNAHHANLKSVFLYIYFKWELYRTLKFLRDYQANLDEVKLLLHSKFPELVNPENRTSFNVFTIPQELVQRTTINIPYTKEDNFQDFFTLLNNLRGDETLKFKEVYTDHTRLSPHQLEMLNQITGQIVRSDGGVYRR